MSESVGSLGEEAVRLLRALAAQNATGHRTDDVADHSLSEGASPEGPHACANGWCPICSVAEFVRQNPEALASVAASASSMLTALRDLIDTAAAPKDPS